MNTKLTGIFTAATCAMMVTSANAQYELEGGKFAMTSVQGTARSIGFGNALGSVGGDFATLSVNPAGIGMYRSSEFMVTPGMRFGSSDGSYAGTSTSDNQTRFGFNNIGLVFTSAMQGRKYKTSNWKSVSFGMGINRTADFNRAYTYKGQSNTTSGSQYFEADAQQYPSSTTNDPGTPAYLGFQSYLLRDGSYTSLVPYQQGINQLKSVQQKGGITELAFSLGGNYQEKLLLGATLGIPILSYRSSSTYGEQTINANASDSFDHFNYNEDLKVTGAGVNLKLGLIYKFNDYFRMGAAFHTPTLYGLSEVYNRSLLNDSKYFAGVNQVVAPENQYNYQVVTPYKAVVSATGMLGKYGFISVDYEYVNYASIRYYMDDKATQNDVNNNIKSMYKSASNVRAGFELRFDAFMVRGGIGFYGSPFKDDYYQTNRSDISGGLGYRFDNMFVDFAIIHSAYSFHEVPYSLPFGYTQPSTASIDNRQTTAVITFGVKM